VPEAVARLRLASWCRDIDALHNRGDADAAAALALVDSLERMLDIPRRLCERAVAADCAAVMAHIDKLAAHAQLDLRCDKARLLAACASTAQVHPALQEYLAEHGPDGEWLPRHTQLLASLQAATDDEDVMYSEPSFGALAHAQNSLWLYCDNFWERPAPINLKLPDDMCPEEVMLLVSSAIDLAARDSKAEFRIIHGIYEYAIDFEFDLAVQRASCGMDASVLAKTLLALGALNRSCQWNYGGQTYPSDAAIAALLDAIERTGSAMGASEAASTLWALTALAQDWTDRGFGKVGPERERRERAEGAALLTLQRAIGVRNPVGHVAHCWRRHRI
jgi:hypothetical protein